MDQLNNHWWRAPKGEAHVQLMADLSQLRDLDQGGRMAMWSRFLGAYLDREIASAMDLSRFRTAATKVTPKLAHLNVSRSALDAVSSKIAGHRTNPMAMTHAGRWKDREKAKKLERWIQGFLYREKYYQHVAPHVFLDGGIFGTGAVKFVTDDDGEDFHLEWTWVGELWVDEAACAFSEPQTLYQVRHFTRQQLLAKFPRFREFILGLDDVAANEDGTSVTEVVEVVEAWHLKSKPGADDGKHVIVVDGLTLFEEKWNMDCFPFVFWHWGMTPIGFWGTGVMEELSGIQAEINKLLERIQESMHVNATSWVFVPKGANIDVKGLGNRPGKILPYDGPQPPTAVTPPSMHGQVFDHVWRLRDAAYEVVGISQMSAASVKPAGLESGRALRTMQDVESQRFMILADRWQEYTIRVVERALEFAREVYGNRSLKVAWGDTTVAEEIDWKDVRMDKDAFVLRMYPVNFLPSTPAGKMERIEELARLGIFDRAQIQSLMDFPDLQRAMDLNTASYEDLQMIMDDMLYNGKEWQPQEEMDLERSIAMAQHYWCLGHKDGAPQDRLNLLVTWMRRARQLLQKKAQKEAQVLASMQPPPGAMGPGGPMGPMGPEAGGPPPIDEEALLGEAFMPEGPAEPAPAGGAPLGGLTPR
jgi:hypothetical protein